MLKLIRGDCLDLMQTIPDGSIDLTVTSPPYDNLRTYNGNIAQWSFDKFKGIAKELYRVTKQGGVVVWVVADATIKGSETGTSFKQALWFMDCGFSLHDTMIYQKTTYPPNDPKQNRYVNSFEYMFVFSSGKPKVCNYITEKAKRGGECAVGHQRSASGKLRLDRKEKNKGKAVKDYKLKSNVWDYAPAHHPTHPAPFPEQLANDHVISWSNPSDTVLDPFMGSGTTGKMAVLNGRDFIGIELDAGYFKIASDRINKVKAQVSMTDLAEQMEQMALS